MHPQLPDPCLFFKIFLCCFITLILSICFFSLMFVSGCQYLPTIADDIDDIATDNAITIEISRETFQKGNDIDFSLKVHNKEIEVNP